MRWLALIRPKDWRYWLSKIVPVPMHSDYTVTGNVGSYDEHADWWQWRGHVLRARTRVA